MADIAALNTVYNHFLTTYAPQGSNSKYDTHSKRELRGVYDSIVKMNKEAPLFLLDTGADTQEFAVGLKEGARSLKNVISSVSPDEGENLLSKKAVSSSDESIVTASFIGDVEEGAEAPSFEMEVKALARNQINIGKNLPENEMALAPDTYSFDIHSRDLDYEFQFNIGENDTNRTIEEKLARLINKSKIGLHANVNPDGEGNVALRLESDDTGLRNGEPLQFNISDDKTSKTKGAVDYFGLNNIDTYPSDSSFILNGEERSTVNNTFTIDKTFEITLNGVSKEGESVSVGLKTDVESITENITHLIEGYNSFLNKTAAYLDSQPHSNRLMNELNGISGRYGSALKEVGLNVKEDGTIELDRNTLQKTAQEPDALKRFGSIKEFTGNILNKANEIQLNPMEYTNRTIVAYKNPGKSFASPYVTSNYSGMMFSSYC